MRYVTILCCASLVVLLSTTARAADGKIDGAKIEQLTGATGKLDEKENVFKVSMPRSDLNVTAGGVKLTPPMGLTCWAAFTRAGEHTMVMGDQVLLEDQVNPVMSVALDNGLEVTAITLIVSQPTDKDKPLAAEGDLCFDSLSVDSEKSAEETLGGQVSVVSPDYCSDVKGDTTVTLAAAGFKNVTVKCWKQGDGFGSDSTVATVPLDPKGAGSFVFPADQYPHGPITVRISGENGPLKDNCYLQLYNKGGVSWNEGIPKDAPPAAAGMSLVLADDFDGPLSISSTDPKARYYDHKPPGGWQDFSSHRFAGHDSKENPFSQVDTYLRIRASDKLKSAGLISSMKSDSTGITATAPCYFECRFIGPNAVGTWPGFWLMTDYVAEQAKGRKNVPCDELDVIEAYGGEGPHEPNAFDAYMISPHCWEQGAAGKAIEKKAYEGLHNPIHLRKFGIPSTWFEAFHTYGCKITQTDTIYYCDNIEVGRHATYPLSKQRPFFFLVDLATGGGWPVDLARYDGLADMYVDYVRVYQGKP